MSHGLSVTLRKSARLKLGKTSVLCQVAAYLARDGLLTCVGWRSELSRNRLTVRERAVGVYEKKFIFLLNRPKGFF